LVALLNRWRQIGVAIGRHAQHITVHSWGPKMLRSIVLKLIHSLATSFFTALEVTGLPRVPADGEDGGEG
jgi:hypothetical protein